MAFGINIWDGGGNLILNATPSLARTLGIIVVNNDGSLSNDQFYMGRPWYWVHMTNTDAAGYVPKVKVNGNVLSWSYIQNSNPKGTAMIFYGIY